MTVINCMLSKSIFMRTTKKIICICAKDVSRITGRSARGGRDFLYRMRKRLKKRRHQIITLDEFCDYSGLKRDDVLSDLQP